MLGDEDRIGEADGRKTEKGGNDDENFAERKRVEAN